MKKSIFRLSTFAYVFGVFSITMSMVPVFAAESEAGAAIGSMMMLCIICCSVLIAFLIPFAFAYWVYNDAVKNNVENPMLWAVVTFFFTLIGLLIYLLAIRPDAIKSAEGK
jgi:hypothetical protein